jgi:hypothetical protein
MTTAQRAKVEQEIAKLTKQAGDLEQQRRCVHAELLRHEINGMRRVLRLVADETR